MKRNRKRTISVMLTVLLISTQPVVMARADSVAPADYFLEDDGNTGMKIGYATPADADQKDEDASKPGSTSEGDEMLSHEIYSKKDLTDGKQSENEISEKTAPQWEFMDDDYLDGGEPSLTGVSPENRADFGTVISMLPEQVRVEIEETGEMILPIIDWSCQGYQKDEDGEWPLTGEYELIAELLEGYVCEPPIPVLVTLGGAMMNTINDRFTVDGLKYKELGSDTVQLMEYNGVTPVETLVIPGKTRKLSNGREYQVANIGHNAFPDCSGLTGDSVIPNTVTEIGDNAFRGCHLTGELTLSNSLVAIGEDAFHECGPTGQLALPQTLAHIGDYALENTTFSGQLILPENSNYTGTAAFYLCDSVGDLIILDGVAIIDYGTFYGNSFTGTLTLPKKLRGISSESFYRSGFVGELSIPDTITDTGESALARCGLTGELILPDGLANIGPYASTDCSKLTGRLSIPGETTGIGDDVFDSIDFDGFDTAKRGIADLLYVSGVDINKTKVGNQSYQPAFSPQKSTEGGMEYQVIGSDTVALTGYNGNSDTDISIPDKVTNRSPGTTYFVTHIGSKAFYNKTITGSLHLPNTLISIGDSVFYKNRFTGDLAIPADVSHMGSGALEFVGFIGDLTIEGELIKLEGHEFFECGFTGVLSLPDTLTYIGVAMFRDCGFTGSLQPPAGITYTDASSSFSCNSFTGTLQLPAGVNYTGDYSSFSCSGLIGVLELPKPITEIGELAFFDCDGLDSAHLGPNVQKLGVGTFPESLSLSADAPRAQFLINTRLNQGVIADTSWDGMENAPDGAIATVEQGITVIGDRRAGTEVVIMVPSGVTLTVDGSLVADETIFVDGTLVINGPLSGSGTLTIGANGRVVGDTSGIHVVFLNRGSSGNNSGSSSTTDPNLLIGTWEWMEDGIWKLRRARGTYAVNRWGIADGLQYYFDKDGWMLTDWQLINNQWYYPRREEDVKTETGLKEGVMVTGWYPDSVYQVRFYLDTSGIMAVGQKMTDGK